MVLFKPDLEKDNQSSCRELTCRFLSGSGPLKASRRGLISVLPPSGSLATFLTGGGLAGVASFGGLGGSTFLVPRAGAAFAAVAFPRRFLGFMEASISSGLALDEPQNDIFK